MEEVSIMGRCFRAFRGDLRPFCRAYVEASYEGYAMTTETKPALPPLPEPDHQGEQCIKATTYTASLTRSYGHACYDAALAAKPATPPVSDLQAALDIATNALTHINCEPINAEFMAQKALDEVLALVAAAQPKAESALDDNWIEYPKAMLTRDDWDATTRKPKAVAAPVQDAHGAYSDCCDTPHLCSAVRRCTAKDGESVAPSDTVDGPEFRLALRNYAVSRGTDMDKVTRDALIANIDQWHATGIEAERKERDEMRAAMYKRNAELAKELAAARQAKPLTDDQKSRMVQMASKEADNITEGMSEEPSNSKANAIFFDCFYRKILASQEKS